MMYRKIKWYFYTPFNSIGKWKERL
jgi:hypothetical protein